MQRFRKLRRDCFWALLGVAVLLLGCIFLIRNSIDWAVVVNGPGDAIPATTPNESNRVSIASCSIVLPERWHRKTYFVEETGYTDISAWPDSVLPSRYGAGIRVEVSPERPKELEKMTERSFLGYRALESVLRREDEGYENPPLFSYTVSIEINSIWYTLTYWNHEEMSHLPNSVLEYLKTFRVQSEEPTA